MRGVSRGSKLKTGGFVDISILQLLQVEYQMLNRNQKLENSICAHPRGDQD